MAGKSYVKSERLMRLLRKAEELSLPENARVVRCPSGRAGRAEGEWSWQVVTENGSWRAGNYELKLLGIGSPEPMTRFRYLRQVRIIEKEDGRREVMPA